jgi:aryl-phospho-beta-D-glucosidase BglC (GH1 family)
LTGPTADSIAAWHANAVRVPLNDDCRLGLNGQPSYGNQAGYQEAVASWVADLNAAGIHAILDLHRSAPGTTVADGRRPMPDHRSGAFWTSVAGTLEKDPAVLFDAVNESSSAAASGDSGWPRRGHAGSTVGAWFPSPPTGRPPTRTCTPT